MSAPTPPDSLQRAATGIEGLDRILGGGLPRNEIYVIQGEPGTGKTVLGLQYLREGLEAGETCLLLTLSQREDGLRRIATSHGWSLEDLHIHELSAMDFGERLASDQVLFQSSHMELTEMMHEILEVVEQIDPDRVVFDAVSDLRLLANDPARYRHQLFALMELFNQRKSTVLFLDNEPLVRGSGELENLSHGVIVLDHTPTEYGNERRHLRVLKLRGTGYHEGVHDFRIETGGLVVFPRLRPDSVVEHDWSTLESGVEALDQLLRGGLAAGSSCLLVGPSGVGKSSVASLYAYAAAERGDASAVFLFDERPDTFVRRCVGLGMDIERHLESGRITLRQINTGELSPGEFTETIRREVRERGVKVVIIDSLTGYTSAMPDERLLITQMHDILTYLSGQGVLSLLIVAQHGVLGPTLEGPVDVSYLADTVLLLRHFEIEGEIRQAISVFKKRYGAHEKRIRELRISSDGVEVGEPIQGFIGVLSGTPSFTGGRAKLLDTSGEPGVS